MLVKSPIQLFTLNIVYIYFEKGSTIKKLKNKCRKIDYIYLEKRDQFQKSGSSVKAARQPVLVLATQAQ